MNVRHRITHLTGLVWVLLFLAGCGSSFPQPSPNPEPTPTPGLETIHLAPDGSGDYATLAEAVAAAPAGGTLTFEAGTYRLEEPLNIDKALSLVGAGMDQTEIVAETEGHVVRFNGDGPFAAEGIAFRHEGEAWASVVVVEGGQIAFERCRFAGGREAGLSLGGETTGTVRDSIAETGRAAIGIQVTDRAHPLLVGNTSTGNSYGILIDKQAYPTLENNVCTQNGLDGIRFDDDAGGTARGNESSGNHRTGIAVTGRAQPKLEENAVNGNQGAGLEFAENAGGVARLNRSVENFGGIGVSDEAQPTLEENVITRNVTAGIAYFRSAGGVASRNDCSGNGIDGIAVFEEASPTLEGNTCNDNGERGISYSGTAGGVARNNECSRNKVGIHAAETSDPDLADNHCEENTEADIQDLRP